MDDLTERPCDGSWLVSTKDICEAHARKSMTFFETTFRGKGRFDPEETLHFLSKHITSSTLELSNHNERGQIFFYFYFLFFFLCVCVGL
jgi:hypothetical protein